MNRSRSRLDRFHDTAKNIKTRKQKATHYKLSLLGSIENKITWTIAKIQLILPEGDVHVVTLEHFVGKVAGVGAQVILCHPFHLQVAPLQHNILTYSTINQPTKFGILWIFQNNQTQEPLQQVNNDHYKAAGRIQNVLIRIRILLFILIRILILILFYSYDNLGHIKFKFIKVPTSDFPHLNFIL